MGTRSCNEYSLWCETENKWKSVIRPINEDIPTKCPTNTAHTVDETRTKVVAKTLDLLRVNDEDGSLVAKIDPGMPDTDPRYYPDGPHTIGADQVLDFIAPFTAAGKRFQGVRVQVQNGKPGDTVDLMMVSDGTFDAGGGPIPDDTIIQEFGPINAPMADGGGWAEATVPPPSVATTKLIPDGLRLEIRYSSTSEAGTRKMLVDYLMQE
jgi:hypothetical protein